MKALAIDGQGKIVYGLDVAAEVRSVDVAGAVTVEGSPVNMRSFRVSRSQANLKRATSMDLVQLTECSHRGQIFYIA